MHIKINEIVSCVPLCERITRLNRKMIDWLERRKKKCDLKIHFCHFDRNRQTVRGFFFRGSLFIQGKNRWPVNKWTFRLPSSRFSPLILVFFSFFDLLVFYSTLQAKLWANLKIIGPTHIRFDATQDTPFLI